MNAVCPRLAPTFALLFSLLTLQTTAVAAGPDFSRDILPILSDKCFVCHGPDAEDDELRLDSFAAATEDRGGYRAIDTDHPADSALLERIISADDPMPPADAERQLTPRERRLLQRWVHAGGDYATHWAFTPPRRDWPARTLDDFIADSHHEHASQSDLSVDFAPAADPATLARRVALVLTGLPPTADQLQAYLAEPTEQAYGRLVESLLASPRYGEHQARYWLDAVRYGDTHGLHLDNRRGIYPYRDWVVRAFNQNLPFDQFITWQLAGDLLPNPSLQQRVATGFVRMNPTTSEGGVIPAEFQAKNNFDRTETLGTVLLGMSLACARCHTHKYDPITQSEYYHLLAFFNSTAEGALDGNKYQYGPTIKAPENQADWTAWEQSQRAERALRTSVAEFLSNQPGGDSAANTGLQAWAEEAGPLAQSPWHDVARILWQQRESLQSRFTTTLVAAERKQPRETKLLIRGEYDKPQGEPLQPDVLSVLGALPEGAPRNRLGLAQWLTAREHPLVARVLVNRIWQRVFGDGLVRTPEDFGVQGQYPTHPQLLDWLAVQFQDSGWDVKQLLRLMVTSRTFRQSSAARPTLDDPENRLYARASSYRLDAEVIRDVGLWASGLLQSHMGGEGVKPYQPKGMWQAMAHPASNTKKYVQDRGDLLYRRSIYVYWKRTSPHPMMTLFDAPDRESSCVRRGRTTTSLQSLGLLNETQRVEMARKLAERLLHLPTDDAGRIQQLYQWLACRAAKPAESEACLKLLATMRERYSQRADDAKALLDVGESARGEKLPTDTLAAWTHVASIVLASDAALTLY